MTRLAVCIALLVITTRSAARADQPNALTPAEKKEGWKLLFDGKSTAGWTARPAAAAPDAGPVARDAALWAARDGELVTVKTGARGPLASNEAYGDFVLRLEFWIDESSNSGVFIRAPQTGDVTQQNAFEVNLFDGHKQWPTGSINGVQKTSGTPRTVNRWNALEVTARGNQLAVVLDGAKVVEAKASRLPRGPIALQYAGGVKFRNIRIKPLPR